MGIWEVTKRLILGKPVFSNDDLPPEGKQPADWRSQQTAGTQDPRIKTPIDQSGRKIVPTAAVTEIECRMNGGSLECWGHIQNQSDGPIELDKINLLGMSRELDASLKAGEDRQLLLYSGPQPHDASQTSCQLQYKNESGDYFVAEHFVEYDVESDGSCSLKQLRFLPPVRDV